MYYSVLPDKPLRTDFVRHQTVGQLLQLLAEAETSRHNEGKTASDALARP